MPPGSSKEVPLGPPPVDLPPDTQALAEEFVPGTTEWEEVPLLEKSSLVIRFMPKRFNVIVPQSIVLFLEVVDRKTGKGVSLPAMKVRLRPFGDPSAVWTELAVADDGLGEDEKKGDGRFTATYSPNADAQAKLLGRVSCEGVVESKEAGIRRIPATLIYTKGPRARLTGAWKDEAKDGHLFLSAEVEVDDAGTFTLMAQLTGSAREPIALTRAMTKLEAGKHWVTMRVWGKVIRESAVDGPYQVRNVLLTRDMNAKGDYDPGPTIELAHTTKAYKATQFTFDAYHEPAAAPAEAIGPDHPSQKDKPPPLFGDRDRKAGRAAAGTSSAPPPVTPNATGSK